MSSEGVQSVQMPESQSGQGFQPLFAGRARPRRPKRARRGSMSGHPSSTKPPHTRAPASSRVRPPARVRSAPAFGAREARSSIRSFGHAHPLKPLARWCFGQLGRLAPGPPLPVLRVPIHTRTPWDASSDFIRAIGYRAHGCREDSLRPIMAVVRQRVLSPGLFRAAGEDSHHRCSFG